MKKMLVLAAFFGFAVIPLLGQVADAQGSPTARWVNATTIEYDGKTYYDGNPIDGNHTAEVAASNCPEDNWHIAEYSENKETLDRVVNKAKPDAFGNCADQETPGPITFVNPDQGYVLGYKTSANTVQMFMFSEGQQGQAPPLGIYKSTSGQPSNRYFLETEGGVLDPNTYYDFDGNGRIENCHIPQAAQNPQGACDNNVFPFKLANGGDVTELPQDVGVTSGGGQTAKPADKSCESQSNIGWALCPLMQFLDEVATKVDEQINRLLEVRSAYYNDPGIKAAWARIRNIAYIILIPIMLVMVLGTMFGFNTVDAYTVKRALPRLVAATIFISLSWTITSFLITFTNVLGAGIQGLITSAVVGANEITLVDLFKRSVATDVTLSGFALVGLVGLIFSTSIGIILSYLFVAAVFLFISFLVLAFRQFLVVALALVAPLAILAWIFPGNDKAWKLWWGTFSKLLLMFPLISLLIGAGKVFAYIVDQAGGTGLINSTLKLAAYILPYVFIPFTFKWAGGIFAAVSGLAEGREKGLFDRQKKYRGEARKKTMENTAAGNRFRSKNPFTRRVNRAMQTATLLPQAGLRPSNMKSNITTARSARTFEAAQKFLEENEAARAIKSDDDKLWAAMNGRNEKQIRAELLKRGGARFADPKVLDNAVSEVMRFQKESGFEVGRVAATIAQAGSGTGYNYKFDDDTDDMLTAIIAASGDDRGLSGRMLGAMRPMAQQSGRIDLAGGGFAKQAQTLDARRAQLAGAPGGLNQADARMEILQDVLNSNGAAVIAGKKEAVKFLAPLMKANVDDSLTSGDTVIAARELAKIAGRYDAAAQVAPQNAEVLADGILAQGVVLTSLPQSTRDMLVNGLTTTNPQLAAEINSGNRSGITYQQAIEALRANPDFQTMRREYQSAAIAAQQQQQLAQPPGTPPGGLPPVVGQFGGQL